MCGLAGFIGPSGDDPHAVIQAMLHAQWHRGPDDAGCWSDGRVTLGHVRLSIIDPHPHGRQPFVTDDGTGVVAYNGEIYNFRALRAELASEGVRFRTETDTEVLLQALHCWGVEPAVARLDGMFAFAYLDGRTGTLWLARDRMGIKPLYVAERAGAFVFASEIKALFPHPGVPRVADEQALLNLLLYERFDGGLTAFQGVRALAPGTLLCIEPGSAPAASTCFDVLRDVDPARIVAAQNRPFEQIADEFETLLRSSVRSHLMSDVPLATMCSGGLDSSLVTAFAREVQPDVVAYVADVAGVNGEEVRRAALAAQALNVELRVVDVSEQRYFEALPQALASNDQPLFFSQAPAAQLVARAIRDDGHKVVLTGDGADELFGGYDNHAAAYRMWRRRRLHARWLPPGRLGRLLGRLHPRLQPLDLAALARDPLGPTRRHATRVNELNVLLVDGARRQLREARLFDKLGPLARLEDRAFLTASFDDIYVHLREYLRTTDGMAMSQSVENRVPFLDNQLADFGLHLPVSAKFGGGISKRVVRAVAARHLPASLIDLPKIGFGMRPVMWRGTAEFLRRGRVAQFLKWCPADEDDILALLARQPYYQFRLLAMELWWRMTFDGECPGALTERLLALRAP